MSYLIVCWIAIGLLFLRIFTSYDNYPIWIALPLSIIAGLLGAFVVGAIYAFWSLEHNAKKQGRRNDLKGRGVRSKV